MILFGPAGLGPVKQSEEILKSLNKNNLNACEIAFTYGAYIKKPDTIKIKNLAKKYNISLSIHAPYWINLNSIEEEKIKASKKRILKSCEIGDYIGAKNIVFHAGYYGKKSKQETFEKIKKEIIDIKKTIKENNWEVKLCPEIMGKKNVFGSIEEIRELSKQCKTSFCLDIAHILARYGKYNLDELIKIFPEKQWHCHFSGIEYTEKGEKNHKPTTEQNWKDVLKKLKSLKKKIIIINESPTPLTDSILGKSIYHSL